MASTVWLESPVGVFEVTLCAAGISEISLVKGQTISRAQCRAAEEKLNDAERALVAKLTQAFAAYFDAGEPLPSSLALLEQGTDFQRDVWAALRRIPFGETLTYKALAEKVGRPSAWRAVGQACNRNPLLILTPCHRVVGSGRSGLTGFAAGLEVKAALLAHEQRFKRK